MNPPELDIVKVAQRCFFELIVLGKRPQQKECRPDFAHVGDESKRHQSKPKHEEPTG